MSDGTKIYEPINASTVQITNVDTHEVDYGGGDVRKKQRMLLSGTTPNSDAPVTNVAPSPTDYGLNVRTVGSTSVVVTALPEVEVKNDVGNPLVVSGTVTANTGLAQPLTDTQLRASVVPVWVSNPTANPETGLAKDATFAKDADGGIKTHIQNLPVTQAVSAASLPLPAGAATETSLAGVRADLGTDGASPPALSGTGLRGWLRGIYERLGGTLNVSQRALASGTDSVSVADSRSLTERMFAKAPLSGHSLYLDTADATYIYLAEAPTGAAVTDVTFQGIRVVKDANGNPLGGVQTATAFAWGTRASATWAS